MPQARFRKFPARPHGWPDMMIRPQGVEPDLTPPEVDQAPPEGAGDEPHPEFHFTERSTLKLEISFATPLQLMSIPAPPDYRTFSQTPAQGGPPETATKAAPQSPKPSAEEGGEKSGEKPSKTPHRQSGV